MSDTWVLVKWKDSNDLADVWRRGALDRYLTKYPYDKEMLDVLLESADRHEVYVMLRLITGREDE